MNLYQVYMISYDESERCTWLYGLHGECVRFRKRPLEFLNAFCLWQGSSMEGRMDSFRRVLNVDKKIPVLVNRYQECIFFPIMSIRRKECVWLQAKWILKVSSSDTCSCIVHFIDGSCVKLDVGARVIYKQLKRCRIFMDQITKNVELKQLFEE